MPQPKPQPWTVDEFFAWQAGQPDRHELVAGFPLRMMAGARNVHDDIVVNPIAELRAKLRGRDCRPFTGDGSVCTGPAQVRRPDAGVDCARRDPDGLSAADPRLVAEVLSPTTRDLDTFDKVAEFSCHEIPSSLTPPSPVGEGKVFTVITGLAPDPAPTAA